MNARVILEKERSSFEGEKLNGIYLTNPVCKQGSQCSLLSLK